LDWEGRRMMLRVVLRRMRRMCDGGGDGDDDDRDGDVVVAVAVVDEIVGVGEYHVIITS
jgi:hypothetical protein